MLLTGFGQPPVKGRQGAFCVGDLAVALTPDTPLQRREQSEIDVHRLERLGDGAAGNMAEQGA